MVISLSYADLLRLYFPLVLSEGVVAYLKLSNASRSVPFFGKDSLMAASRSVLHFV